MDDRRSRIRRVFEGEVPDCPPVSMRMDIWHTHAVNTNSLPAEVAGMSVEQVEDLLGFCRSARYRTHVRLSFPEGWVDEDVSGDVTTTTYSLPTGALRKVFRHTAEEKQAGMGGQVMKYPIACESECRTLLEALDGAQLAGDFDAFDEFDREAGDAGLPLLILGECPVGIAQLHLMGYENFFYALADYPDLLSELISRLGRMLRSDVWPRAIESGAKLVMHGSHFSDATTPPPIFERFMLGYLAEFNRAMHSAGKRVLWHSDAGMGSLLGHVIEAGYDGADCLATAPLVREKIEDYYDAWQGRIVCWGGLPGTIFNREYPRALFRSDLDHLREFAAGKPGFIIGASDNVMPGAMWERIVAVKEAFR